jgi:hypothetical protein
MLAVVKASNIEHKADILDDDVILNVPGWRKHTGASVCDGGGDVCGVCR